MNIKICGIRNLEVAIAAERAGATHLGLNFIASSRRYSNETDAMAICRKLQGRVKLVGIFQNMPLEVVNDIATRYHLNYAQLHGTESPDYCRGVTVPIIKAIPIDPRMGALQIIDTMRTYDCELFLLDRPTQGSGELIDLAVAREIAESLPCFIAGGLTVDNVAEVVGFTHPYGVDVAGGIETGQQSDPEKIRQFVKNARLSAS